MKIAILQFSPSVGAREENIQRAEKIIVEALQTPQSQPWDWLILPEMAFSGYNFTSAEEIQPFLEPTTSGRTTQWAQAAAERLNCHITVGYPEITTSDPPKRYNSTVTVSPTGQILLNYRKSFLYYTDETWAEEGDRGFFSGPLGIFGDVSHGICMDINPYKFTSPWTEYEFAKAAVTAKSGMIVVSMAWLTHTLPEEIARHPLEPDLETISYWLERFYPVVSAQGQEPVIMIFANRCGQEGGACYAGSSAAVRIKNGRIEIFDRLGKNQEKCMVVDLDDAPKWAIQHRV